MKCTSKSYPLIETQFSGARVLTIRKFFENLHTILTEHGHDSKHSLVGLKTCRDDNGGYLRRKIVSLYGNPGYFTLETLGALSYTGETSYLAMSHHLKNESNKGPLVLVYLPHIGLSQSGIWGVVEREGRSDLTTDCGALAAVLDHLVLAYDQNRPRKNPYHWKTEPEMYGVAHHLLPHLEQIRLSYAEHGNRIQALLELSELAVRVSREQTQRGLEAVLRTKPELLDGHPVIIAGGLFVNTSGKDDIIYRNSVLYRAPDSSELILHSDQL